MPTDITTMARTIASRMYPIGPAGNEDVAEMIEEAVRDERERCASIATRYEIPEGISSEVRAHVVAVKIGLSFAIRGHHDA